MSEGRKLTLNDIYALEQVIDAQISPDGKTVAFVVTRDYSEPGNKTPAASIWIVPTDGGSKPVRFTSGSHADRNPRWSPDGKTLAFLSDRDKADVLQIYTIPATGGEAQKKTNSKGGVVSLKWNADGSRLAYVATDGTSDEEDERNKVRDDAKHLDHDYKFNRLWTLDLASGASKLITDSPYQVQDFAWYENGWAILKSKTPLLNEMNGWEVLSVGEDRPDEKLWQVSFASHGISSSEDGQSLAWVDVGSNAETSADELWIKQPGKQPVMLTKDFAGGLAWTKWFPDGKSLLVGAIDGVYTRLGSVDVETGAKQIFQLPRNLTEGFVSHFQASISKDGQQIACVLEDGTHPKDVWLVQSNNEATQLSFFNSHLEGVELGKTERVTWKAADGLEIEGVLILPSGYVEGQSYPLVADIHGGPTWEWLDRFMGNWHDWGQWLAANGYAVLLPNPRGSAGRGREFAWCNRQNWGIGDFGDVLSGVDAMVERGIANPDKLGIGGWSYGGFMTAWAIGHTDRFKAAIVGAGVTNLLSFQASDISNWLPDRQILANPYTNPEVFLRSSPITAIDNVTTPTLIIHGESDERVRIGQGRELYNGLRYLNKEVEMVTYPREPHSLSELHHQRDMLQRVVSWFDKYLKG